GVGGTLYAFQTQFVSAAPFDFTLALTFVLMTVVGGLESRAGVIIGSAFFALFPLYMGDAFANSSNGLIAKLPDATPFIGAALLILTLIQFPGGIGQQIAPLTRWLAGKPRRPRHRAPIEAGAALATDTVKEPPSAEELAAEESTEGIPVIPGVGEDEDAPPPLPRSRGRRSAGRRR
ncbi:MAG: hypothetical protein LC722_03940, partial [Actinobacteria bacterium]|nr:hypothetical protein [Actinomycetota bacterium]